MKSRKLIVTIKSGKQLKSEMILALKGEKKGIQPKNQVIFNSVKSFMCPIAL